jgi:hypothetical protein
MEGQIIDDSKFLQLKEIRENMIENSLNCVKALEKELVYAIDEKSKSSIKTEILNAKINYHLSILKLKKHMSESTNDENELIDLINSYISKRQERKPITLLLNKIKKQIEL